MTTNARKIFVLNGHPATQSLCGHFFETYIDVSKRAGAQLKTQSLHEMRFDPNLHAGYRERMTLEPDLITWRDNVVWAEHLVLFYPVWWGGMPAKLKGLFDRAFLPGFAMNYHDNDPFWDPLLKGRSAHIFLNADAPPLWDLIMYGRPARNQVKHLVWRYAGLRPVKVTQFGGMRRIEPKQVDKYLARVRRSAAREAS